jgi:hypothetical protein
MPILVPIHLISDICAMQGLITEIKAPEKNPYIPQNTMIDVRFFEISQITRQDRPEKNAEGNKTLKQPNTSDTMAGTIRPSTPPAFITART